MQGAARAERKALYKLDGKDDRLKDRFISISGQELFVLFSI